MEWLGIGLGVAALGVAGVILARWKATAALLGARYKRLEELADDLDLKAWERRYKSLAADVEDLLDKVEHRFDRERKRRAAETTPREDVPNGQAFPTPRPNGASHVVSVSELVRRSSR